MLETMWLMATARNFHNSISRPVLLKRVVKYHLLLCAELNLQIFLNKDNRSQFAFRNLLVLVKKGSI